MGDCGGRQLRPHAGGIARVADAAPAAGCPRLLRVCVRRAQRFREAHRRGRDRSGAGGARRVSRTVSGSDRPGHGACRDDRERPGASGRGASAASAEKDRTAAAHAARGCAAAAAPAAGCVERSVSRSERDVEAAGRGEVFTADFRSACSSRTAAICVRAAAEGKGIRGDAQGRSVRNSEPGVGADAGAAAEVRPDARAAEHSQGTAARHRAADVAVVRIAGRIGGHAVQTAASRHRKKEPHPSSVCDSRGRDRCCGDRRAHGGALDLCASRRAIRDGDRQHHHESRRRAGDRRRRVARRYARDPDAQGGRPRHAAARRRTGALDAGGDRCEHDDLAVHRAAERLGFRTAPGENRTAGRAGLG